MITLASLSTTVLGAASTLTWNQFLALIGIMCGMFLLVGLGLILRDHGSTNDLPVVRGWLAGCLVMGLLVLTAATLVLTDATNLQSLLFGGVVAAAGTAIAFYFATRNNDDTQRNLLNAAFNVVQHQVPTVKGESLKQAQEDLENAGFVFAKDSKIQQGDQVDHCVPRIGTMQPVGSTVTVFK